MKKYDVVIAGYGLSGALAAYWCSQLGLSCCVLEKKPYAGGISILAGGEVRCSSDAEKTFNYLKHTNNGTCPDDVLLALAKGMTEIYDDLKSIASEVGSVPKYIKTTDSEIAQHHYGFPGWDSLDVARIDEANAIDLEKDYPNAVPRSQAVGWKLYGTVDKVVRRRDVPIYFGTPITKVDRKTKTVNDKFSYDKLIIATGGFEADPELQKRNWQLGPTMHNGFDGNTGDGIKLVNSWGAENWHMWHFHAGYGFKHPAGFGIRLKGLGAWNPTQRHLAKSHKPVNHIVVDQKGRRYMNEWTSYYSDTGARAMDYFDSDAVKYPRVPSYFISTEQGRLQGPWGSVTFNMPNIEYKNWTEDNMHEIELGMIKKCNNINEVAEFIGCQSEEILKTFDKVSAGEDEFDRPDRCAIDLNTPPYYVAPVYPTVGNTQGGPRHDLNHQPLNSFGEIVDKDVYVIGDCGSSFGWLYMSAGNWAECFVSAKNSVHHIKKSQ
jgi:hypothetical protein